MCWVLDGVLGARACACNERVRLRVCSCVCLCSFWCVRARVYACLCERVCGFVRFHRIALPRGCVASVCARPPIARRRLAVFIARPAPRVAAARAVAFGATGRLSRAFGRRCDVDEPHTHCTMGWPI